MDRTTIYSGLGIRPGRKMLDLNDKFEVALRNRVSEVTFLITDELSMVSSDLCTDVHSRLGEMFMMIPEKEFGCLSVMTAAHLLQLPPVRGKG